MLRFLTDENFHHAIIRGLQRRSADIDMVRVQDVGLMGADDPTILAWAANENRILLTHDVETITKFAYERVSAGEHMPGVFEISRTIPLGEVIDDLLLLVEASLPNEWVNQVRYLPLR